MRPQDTRFAARFDNVTGSAIRDIFKLLGKPGMISFAGGNPALSALENDVLSGIARDVLVEDGKAILQYGASEGYMPFRHEAVRWLQAQHIEASLDTVLPVSGSTQTVDLLCKALINPGDVILVENPSFLGAVQTMRLYEADIRPLETDGGGVIVERLEEAIVRFRPKLIYLIPTFQNPTGITLAADRRKPIAQLAKKHGVFIMEDDPYRDLRYAGNALPAIKTYDEDGWIVYMASFSKLISPGLRVGVVVAEPTLMRKLVIGKQSTDLHGANLSQAIVAAYLARGLLPAHVAAICESYRAQLSCMLEELEKCPPGVTYTRPEGGLFIWVTLPESMDAKVLLDAAIQRNVAFVPGTHFYCDGGHHNTLRLNFSNSAPDAIREGMGALREAMHTL